MPSKFAFLRFSSAFISLLSLVSHTVPSVRLRTDLASSCPIYALNFPATFLPSEPKIFSVRFHFLINSSFHSFSFSLSSYSHVFLIIVFLPSVSPLLPRSISVTGHLVPPSRYTLFWLLQATRYTFSLWFRGNTAPRYLMMTKEI
jgi:hypothetical protein